MQQRTHEEQIYQDDKIDLRVIFNSLVAKKFLILGLTAFITALAALNTTIFTPTYQAKISFSSASSSSLININKLIYTKETKNSIFTNFLTLLSSPYLQKEVFIENDFLTLLNKDNKPIENANDFFEGFINSFTITNPKLNLEELKLFLDEKPYSISINGDDAEVISNYLDMLIKRANSKNIVEIVKINQQKISIRLDQIAIESKMVLKKYKQDRLNQIERIKEEDGQKIRQINDQIEALKIKAKRDRLNQIERIKEEDGQKIRQINDQIDRVRFEAKEMRLNQIEELTASAKLAKSLGIIENNFKMINNDKSNSDLTIAIGESKDLPEWYLYGERALLQRIKILGSRTSDDPFIPGLVALKNQLNEIQNNNLLKTLETRQDDSPFIPELVTLNLEKNRLESTNLNLLDTNSINRLGPVNIENTSRNKVLFVLVAFFASLMLSILLALIINALKPDEKAHA